jgi:hypothetical protein
VIWRKGRSDVLTSCTLLGKKNSVIFSDNGGSFLPFFAFFTSPKASLALKTPLALKAPLAFG